MPGSLWQCLTTVSFALLLGTTPRAAAVDQIPFKDGSKKPNIIFVLTDDQDLHMASLRYMPHLKKHIADQGTTFTKHYCTVALCCPSRVSLWTGKAAHNTNVTDVNPPYGGYPKFVSQGFNSAYLPIWLQSLGYGTYYVGKLFNAQSVDNYDSPRAAGWTGSEFLLDPFTYEYLNATFVRNHEAPASYEGKYSTDVIAEKSFGFLDDALDEYRKSKTPFFLTIAPTAPHSNVHMNTKIDGNFSEGSNTQSPPIPAERHQHLFDDIVVPRTPHFNPPHPHGVSWISRLPQQNDSNVAFNDHFYRSRIRALQAVDEMIDQLFRRLEAAEILDETYVIFSSDNGYHIGQHRLQPGKQCPFEEDINIPFVIRGPGIPKNYTTDIVTTHTDLAPTLIALAGGDLRDDFDGEVIPLFDLQEAERAKIVDMSSAATCSSSDRTNKLPPNAESRLSDGTDWTTEHINVEMWGVIMSEGNFGSVLYPHHTYKALRITSTYNLLYTVWCSGEHELYNLNDDPYQMHNLYSEDPEELQKKYITLAASVKNLVQENDAIADPLEPDQVSLQTNNSTHTTSIDPISIHADTPAPPCLQCGHGTNGTFHATFMSRTTLYHLLPRLDALLMVLKTCRGRQCTHPWEVLHPLGGARSLLDAMKPKYDELYFGQRKVAFERCERGYLLGSEGPVGVRPYGFDDGL